MNSDLSGGIENATEASMPWRAAEGFLTHMRDTPEAPALRIGGRQLSYQALGQLSQGLARAVQATGAEGQACAIYADRSLESYAGVLAALQLGLSYVPLNPKFPAARNLSLLQRAGAGCVICAPEALAQMQELTRGTDIKLVALPEAGGPLVADLSNPIAYILFTSGSTGTPKGVPISHANLAAYLEAATAVTGYGPQDRFSQTFDLTFDLSVHDMFLCWRVGGELIVPSSKDLEHPADYVQREGVTCWFSVPSLAQKMRLQNSLAPGALSGIRHSLFCGEALPLDLALEWQAATGSGVENWYGPTEATIACLRYALPAEAQQMQGHLGLTPIGDCLPGMRALVLDEGLAEVAMGAIGELYVAGPQLAQSYLADAEKTAAAFVDLPQHGGRFYRTGDRVKRASSTELHFIDRVDNQIKIRGYRVEIGEIEAQLRALSGGCMAVVTPLPWKSPTPSALMASLEGWQGDDAALLAQLAEVLPAYMLPSGLRRAAHFPKNASGKVDRGAIGAALEAESAAQAPAAPMAGEPIKTQNMRRQLIALARQINPGLSRDDILAAPDLMAAGLDSLGFAEFSVRIEKSYGLALDQNLVADMAEMRIGKLAKLVKHLIDPENEPHPEARGGGAKSAVKGQPGPREGQGNKDRGNKDRGQKGKGGKIPARKSVHYKSRRTIECLEQFPAWAAAAEHPLALFFGSSGVAGGIGAELVEARAAALGQPVTAANLGMAKLSNAGTVELVDYVRTVLQDLQKPVAFGVYELELMQLSPLPTGREIEVVQAYLAGDYVLEELAQVDPWNRWQIESGGTILRGGSQGGEAAADQAVAANAQWSQKREQEVTDAYMGRLEFIAEQRRIWLQGAQLAQSFCPRLLSFVHPVSQAALAAAQARGAEGPHLQRLLAELDQGLQQPLLRPADFDLREEDYRDYNHANRFGGRQRLSERLTEVALRP